MIIIFLLFIDPLLLCFKKIKQKMYACRFTTAGRKSKVLNFAQRRSLPSELKYREKRLAAGVPHPLYIL